MELKLWEYIFVMFNYKIRQKKIDFFKITNPYPALKLESNGMVHFYLFVHEAKIYHVSQIFF